MSEPGAGGRWSVEGLARIALIVVGGLFPLAFLVTALLRIGHPYELEWMEGAAVDHVRRVLDGRPLYVEPSVDFVPFIYTPGFHWVAAAVSKVTGLGFLALRLVALGGTLACLGLLFLHVRRETRSAFAGWLALCLFAATYRRTDCWFDIGRVDSLFLALVLAGVHVHRGAAGAKSLFVAGGIFFVAFLCKQTALAIALPFAVHDAIFRRGAARVVFIATVAPLIAGSTLVFDAASDGWYSYYVFDLPSRHPYVAQNIAGFWLQDLGLRFLPALGIALAVLVRLWRMPGKGDFAYQFLFAGGMFGAAWMSRIHEGGFVNVLMPAFASLAILFARGVHEFTSPAVGRGRRAAALCALGLVQFGMLAYRPTRWIPTRADVEAGDRFVALLRRFDGEIYVESHGHLSEMAGLRSFAHKMAVDDVMKAGDDPVSRKLREEFRDAVRARRFSAVVLDGASRLDDELASHYEVEGAIFERDAVYWPVTGMRSRPRSLHVPRERR